MEGLIIFVVAFVVIGGWVLLSHRQGQQLDQPQTQTSGRGVSSGRGIKPPPAPKTERPAAAPTSAAPAAPPVAHDYIERCVGGHHLFIVGGSGRGKTTEARRVIWARRGPCIVLDPHAAPDEWPAGTHIVGGGLDYTAINAVLLGTFQLHVERHQARSKGVKDFPRISILIDEWRSIVRECPDAARVVMTHLAEDRKVGIHLILLNQSRTVKSLGMQGEGELRESFNFVLDLRTRALTDDDGVNHPLPPFEPTSEAEQERYRVLPIEQPYSALLALFEQQPNTAEQAPVNAEQPNSDQVDPVKLARAIALYEEHGGEARAIEEAFEVKRGGAKAFTSARDALRAAIAQMEAA